MDPEEMYVSHMCIWCTSISISSVSYKHFKYVNDKMGSLRESQERDFCDPHFQVCNLKSLNILISLASYTYRT